MGEDTIPEIIIDISANHIEQVKKSSSIVNTSSI